MLAGNLFRGIARDTAAGGETTLSVTGIGALVAALPFTANHIIVKWGALASAGNPSVSLRINGDSSALYNAQDVKGAGGSDTALRTNAATSLPLGTLSSTAFEFSGGEIVIPAAFLATHKGVAGLYGEVENNVSAVGGRYASTDVVDEISLVISSGSYVAASVLEVGVADEMFAIAGAEDIKTEDGTFTVQGIPQLSGDVVLIGNLRTDRALPAESIKIALNDDEVDANYELQWMRGSGASPSANIASNRFFIGATTASTGTANAYGAFVATISNPADGINDPHILALNGYHESSGPGSEAAVTSLRRDNVEPVNKIALTPFGGTNFVAGSMLSAYFVPKNVIAQAKLEADAASVTLTIPAGYRDVVLKVEARTDEAAALSDLDIQLNTDTTAANYDGQRLDGNGSSATATPQANDRTLYQIPGGSATANVFAGGQTTIFEYTSAHHKHLLSIAGAAEDIVELDSMRWGSTEAVSQIVLTVANGDNFLAGSIFTVEGIGKTNIGWEDQAVERGGLAGHGYLVEVDWANTGAMVALSDITADVTSLTWEAGRDIASQLAGRATAGKAVIRLRNNSDQYNRNNSSGPYFGNILPGRKVRITDTTTGQVQFSGFMVNPATMVTQPKTKTAQITAYGILAELARPNINIAKQTSITTGALVDAALDAAGLTSSEHDIDTGQTTVTKYFKSDKQKALGAIREFEFTEAGFIREDHHRDGILAFEDRHHRLKAPGQDSQATFGDGNVGGEFGFDQIQPSDDMSLIFNEFVARVELFTTQSIATLWTHSEANTSGTAPSIPPGESLVVWANYPNPATAPEGRYVDAWITPVATTDYTSNTQTGGGGTDRTGDTSIAVDKLSNAMKITLTNDHATDTIFITSLKARGTAVFADDPAIVREEDTTSQTDYTNGMPKTWERRAEAKWVPSTDEALDWAQYHLGIYKDPSPTIVMGYKGNVDLYTNHEASIRQVSDRITLTLTGDNGTGLDIDEDFYVEKVRHHVNLQGSHRVTLWLSSTAGFSDFWVLGKSLLGTETRVAY